ncbi:MAG: aryl-sulfate sulfotransferase, partial [Planctomycetes bacterium]|nr:aryl-sulfate sulfotransferase [Planctomycetota bacterium]
PNGNVLVIVWDRYTVADAIAAGRDPASITGTDWLPDGILELEPTGPTSANVVWEWHLIDHVIQDFDPSRPNYGVVANHPELLDINYPPVVLPDGDWNHANGIDYDPIHDLIAISCRAQNEIYIIDHSTTTAEAAGHTGGLRGRGGDILWRWGNPAAYRAGTAADQQLDGQHDPRFVPPGYPGAGHLTLFNNRHTPTESAVYELVLPMDPAGNFAIDPITGTYGPAAPVWTFAEPGFFSNVTSSAERLPNGNTLICSGTQNRVFEVTPNGATVSSFVHQGSTLLFQANYVDRTLWADTPTLSVAGDQVGFDHLTGTANAGDYALLLGTLSGRSPGTLLPGGALLPLNADFLTDAMVTTWNTGVFVDTLVMLDASGAGASTVLAPPGVIPPALAGFTLDFAHVVLDGSLQIVRVSNAVSVTLAP